MVPSLPSSSTHYAIVVDAGSSGSRLQIYSWRDPDLERAEIVAEVQQATRTNGKVGGKTKWWWPPGKLLKGKGKGREDELEQRALRRLVRVGKGVEGDEWVKRVEPGISTVNPTDIPEYLSPLLSHALRHIPPSQHSSTPIYLLATAGMRLLPDGQRNAILEATCDTLRKEYPFQVGKASAAGPCGEHVRVISGEEEGVWGWVAVNYLMDGFGHAPPYSTTGAAKSSSTGLLPLAPLADPPPDSVQGSVTPVDVGHHSPTFGFLDMGGASTQLAFSPTAAELGGFPTRELQGVSLRLLSGEDVDWPVFVASWLGFGTNKARDRYSANLLLKWRSSVGEGVPLDLSTPIDDPCLPKGLSVASADPAKQPSLIGTGSFTQCLTELRPLLEHDVPCPSEHCLFGGISTPRIDFERADQRGFIGISEYWYTSEQVLGKGGMWDWGEWEKGMSAFCARDWTDIEVQLEKEKGWMGAEVELSRLQMQCFKGAWISNVLHEGIGIPRLVDAGGKDTITGGELGDVNAEAERRAREKGLLEKPHKSHFQSMDEVGETAISWTLGKMVIEASRAVQPRSYAVEQAWASRLHLPDFSLGKLEAKLDSLGIQVMWAYAFTAFVFFACAFTWARRRLQSRTIRRGRKPSVSGESPLNSTNGWWPMTSRNEDGYTLEEGVDLLATKSPRTTIGTLRLWSIKMGRVLSQKIPFVPTKRRRTSRHGSLPLTNPYVAGATRSPSFSQSQPGSPKSLHSHLFTPIASSSTTIGSLTVPSTRPGSTTPELRASASSVSLSAAAHHSPMSTPDPLASPRKGGTRPARSRQNSNNGAYPSGLSRADVGGWNDPPSSMLHMNGHGHDAVNLTPLVNGGYERTLSRQSSRVNLNDLGMVQRSASRAGTPRSEHQSP